MSIKISIITVCRNSAMFLEETIASIISQTYKNIEYIVIDGNSNDATVHIIQQYSHHIAYWVSEDDDGMYEAINKGLQQATGDYILVLNSDDVLTSATIIEEVANEISRDRLDYYYGDIIKVKPATYKKVKLFTVNFTQLLLSTHGTFVPHPCFFISANLNKALGGYNEAYKYASDYDYILRVLQKKDTRGRHLHHYITRFRIHENSITASGKIESERKAILLNFGYDKVPYLKRFLYYYILWVYYKLINLHHRQVSNL